MDEIVTASVSTPRFAFLLVGLFGGLAIVLAAIGTYGVIAYSVSQRTPEFGLRMALGARRFDVLWLVLLQAGKLILSGTVIGVLLALVMARGLKSLIYEVSPADPLTFTAIGFAVIAIAIVACYIPAREGYGGGSDDCFAGGVIRHFRRHHPVEKAHLPCAGIMHVTGAKSGEHVCPPPLLLLELPPTSVRAPRRGRRP